MMVGKYSSTMPNNFSSIFETSPQLVNGIITALVTGIIGLVFFVVRSWLKKREMRPQLRVELAIATINCSLPAYFAIKATNIGYIEVILSSVGIITPDNEFHTFVNNDPINLSDLPTILSRNDSFTRYLPMSELETYLRKKDYLNKYGIKINLIGFFKDRVGHKFQSKPKKYEMRGW